MASTYLDEFVVNFDLNQLHAEENIQTLNEKYQKLRKATTWLKSKIISTDFAIQKFQTKKDDYDQSVKAHTVTKEALRQACINYKDASDKCVILANENKILLANHEVLEKKVIDTENKYAALMCHSNQLQVLVKQLQNEKDALTVEKELNKCNNKDDSKEIIALQKEKDAMLNDLIALKDVILGKKKPSKRHIKVIEKYVKDIKSKGPKELCTSEVSDDDMNYSIISLCDQTDLNEVCNDINKELTCNAEQNFTDTYSDGEVSVDTGRGSSRANSHDKYLSSPDYVVTLETLLKIPNKYDVKQIDASNSPITVYSSRSVATSPITFDHPAALLESQYDDYSDCVDGSGYIIDAISLSEEIDVLVEQEKLAHCASPVPQTSNFIDPDESNGFDQNSIVEKLIEKRLSQNSNIIVNDKKKVIDAYTSPLPMSPGLRKFVDVGTSTFDHKGNPKLDHSNEFEIPALRNCRKSPTTYTNTLLNEKEYVNACTSPLAKSYVCCKCVDINTNTLSKIESENQMLHNSEKFTNSVTLTNKEGDDVSTNRNLIEHDQPEEVDVGVHVLSKKQSVKSRKSVIDEDISRHLNKKRCLKFKDKAEINSIEQLRTQEKVCLENNSSKNLHFESTNDVEIQNILNVMKLHQDLISPISKTPSDTEYLKLIPEMNNTLAKIWTALANIYRTPNQVRNNDSNLLTITETDDFVEIPETEINNININSDKQQGTNKGLNQDIEDHIISTTNRTYADKNAISTKNTGLELANKFINGNSNIVNSNTFDLDKNSEENNNNTNKTHENKLAAGNYDNNEKRDSQEDCITMYSELNDISEDNFNTCTNNIDAGNITEAPRTHAVIINGTKTKKKSKLEKFRDKLLPTCKIKRVSPTKIKHSSKEYVKSKNTENLSSLNQKKAYENAVKVMAEIRSNQEVQDKKELLKPIAKEVNLRSKSSKTKSPSSDPEDLKMLSTRSRTRRGSKKEKDTTVTANSEQNVIDTEESPVNRKLRKRRAETELDQSQRNSKRMLRSSNILPAQNISVTEQLHNDLDKNSKANIKTVSSSDLLNESFKSMNEGDNFTIEKNICDPQNEDDGAPKPNITFEKSTLRRMKPVVEFSNCLADNANVVSIIPGNEPTFLDVNKNINHTKQSTALDNYMLGNYNNNLNINLETNKSENVVESPNTDNCIEVTNTSKDEASEVLMSKDFDCTSVNEHLNDGQQVYRTEYKGEDSSEQSSPGKSTNTTQNLENKLREDVNTGMKTPIVQLMALKNNVYTSKNNIISYSDLDLYTEDCSVEEENTNVLPKDSKSRKENILCAALDRYGVISVKYVAKKVPDAITLKICQKIEESVPKIIASSKTEQKNKMNDLVASIQNFKTKHILAGFMKYLKDPTRKHELFNKIINGPAPPMTKSEVILLYVIESLNRSLPPGFLNRLWNNIEHTLFQLNRTPEFHVIESMSHFYAVLCRYFRNKSRLRCFMLDAMYCLQFKAVPLIKQCLEVCPGVLPNAHERMAKTSLVTCLVYLLHFYKCRDRFNRAQDIRNILYGRYQYRFSELNETMILEIFRKAIMDLKGTHNDKKMLRVALIILCKRHGAKWCQLNIIQNILLPIIEKKDVPERIKQFCVLMLGPLLKPFPADRKAHCEIVINQLLQMLMQNTSQEMKEAIFSSLIFMSKHDQERVVQALLSWNPENVSQDFQETLNDYVMEKPLALWKKLVTRKPSQCT